MVTYFRPLTGARPMGAGNVEVSQRVADVCLGALAQVVPDRVVAQRVEVHQALDQRADQHHSNPDSDRDPADLAVDAKDPQGRVDEHPGDRVAAEDEEVEHGVDDARQAAMHVQEPDVRVGPVREHEAGDPEHQHVHEEERVDVDLRGPCESRGSIAYRAHGIPRSAPG